MEDNDLPDFDAEDLLAAIAEERRKGESSGLDQPIADATSSEDVQEKESLNEGGAVGSAGELADDPLSEITA